MDTDFTIQEGQDALVFNSEIAIKNGKPFLKERIIYRITLDDDDDYEDDEDEELEKEDENDKKNKKSRKWFFF